MVVCSQLCQKVVAGNICYSLISINFLFQDRDDLRFEIKVKGNKHGHMAFSLTRSEQISHLFLIMIEEEYLHSNDINIVYEQNMVPA